MSEDSGNADAFRVNLSVFAGPVDLLLYLIRKNELDVHDISISQITREYLEYVELIKMIDLESAGDFIVTASNLLKIKSRSLFESHEAEHAEDEEISTRDALIQYLLEFEKLGGVADKLAEKEEERLGIFPRGGERSRIVEQLGNVEPEPDYMLFDLLSAMKDVLANAPKMTTHDVELMNVTSEMKQAEILRRLSKEGPIDFIEYVTGQPKLIIVVTFIAMLELIKTKQILVKQSTQFGTIYIYERTDDNITDH